MKRLLVSIAALVFGFTLLALPGQAIAAIDKTRDCDTVAIIRCGAMSGRELREKAKQGDVPRVYAAFDIQQNELNGFVDGVVWKNGNVNLGGAGKGELVATNAVTAARWNNPKPDMTRIPNTDRAYKMSTSHFVDDGQIAFIKMVNGKFSFAVLKTCGNPVTAKPVKKTPEKKPGLTITKDVASTAARNWTQTVTVKPGDPVLYRVIAKNTGETTLQNVSFREVLPNGITYYSSPVYITLNGQNISNDLNDGLSMGNLKPGEKFELIYAAQTSFSENRSEACRTGLTNRVFVKADGVKEKSDTAVVKVCAPVKPTPDYSCDILRVNSGTNRSMGINTFKVTASGGAVFKRAVIDWGDGATTEITNLAGAVGTVHQYNRDGEFTIKATAYFTVPDKSGEVSATSVGCTQEVTFTPDEPPAVVTPPQEPGKTLPARLADTGPGAIIGALFSTITGGTLAYRLVWLRRFGA